MDSNEDFTAKQFIRDTQEGVYYRYL